MSKTPKRLRAKMYVKYCTIEELGDLIEEWRSTDDEKMLHHIKKCMKKHKKFRHLFK